MNSIELAGPVLIQHGWLLTLMFNVATLCVALLRRPCRYLFGAECAFHLWLLPPLVLLVSQLPHQVGTTSVALPALMVTIITGAGTWQAMPVATTSLDWRGVLLGLWSLGMILTTVFAVIAQLRYRRLLHGATVLVGWHTRWPVWRAARANVGPALMGVWRPRIVLPADFDSRYDAYERALILAHEAAHAHRRDGYWALCAQAFVSVFWFHPLMWWALRAFRHDQELACDAVVLRQHGELKRSYANAMLKTQSVALPLPVGCQWSPRHPITERIAMLKQDLPTVFRRRAGGLFGALLAVCAVSAVYAATPSAHESGHATVDSYTLKVVVAYDGKQAGEHFTQCLKPGEYFSVNGVSSSVPAWKGRFTVLPVAGGQIEVRGEMSGGTLHAMSHPTVRTMPGQQATILIGNRIVAGKPSGATQTDIHSADMQGNAAGVQSDMKMTGGDQSIRVDLTPSMGC